MAPEHVVAALALDDVIAAVAMDLVGKGIAGSAAVAGGGQGQVLEIVSQRIAGAGLHKIGAFSGLFDEFGRGAADDIGVIALAAVDAAGDLADGAIEIIVAAAQIGRAVNRSCVDDGLNAVAAEKGDTGALEQAGVVKGR